jgi:hypothetical protein
MTDHNDKREGQTGAAGRTHRTKNSRQDRLKLALRENLKRRKSQARRRSDVMIAPCDDDMSPHGESRKRPGD